METSWTKLNSEDFVFGSGVFVPMLEGDRAALIRDLKEMDEEYGGDGTYMEDERLLATHFFISINIPDIEPGDTEEDRANYTWWDFGAIPARMGTDGEWELWYDDVYSTGNVWYQSTYTEAQVRAVYERAIKLASEGRLYDDLYESCKSDIMKFW